MQQGQRTRARAVGQPVRLTSLDCADGAGHGEPVTDSSSLRPDLVSRRQALMAGLGAGALLGGAGSADAQALPGGPAGADIAAIHPVGLFSTLSAPQVPARARFILSTGYRVPGKGIALYADTGDQTDLTTAGHALYDAAIAAAPARAAEIGAALAALERRWRVRAADGRWFGLASPHESDMFGTLGDGFHRHNQPGPRTSVTGGTIVTADAQAYLDYCTYWVGEECRWSAGGHLVDDVLHAGYGDTFRQSLMRGAGARYFGEAGFAGTAFFSTRRDRPVFSFAGQRSAVMRDLSITGHFISHRRAANLAAADAWAGPSAASNGRHDVEPEAWVDPANPASADSRYAPYAAVTVDAYAGTRPATAYPPPVYPVWLPRLQPWSGAALSSAVTLERVSIAGFVVGVMVGPSNDPRQGDFVQVHESGISDCKWAVSVGNHQSRNVAVRDTRIGACWTAFTNNTHGAQAGAFGGAFDNVAIGETINLIDFNSYAGAVVFTACYGEALWRLGWYTGGNSFTSGPTFTRCTWNLSHVNAGRGRPATILSDRLNPASGGHGVADFPGTRIAVQSVAVVQKPVGPGALLIQPEERVNGVADAGQAWRRDAANALHGGLALAGLDVAGRDYTIETLQLDLDGGPPLLRQAGGSPAPRRVGSAHDLAWLGTDAAGDRVPRPRAFHTLPKGLIARGSVVQRGRELSFSLTQPVEPYAHGTLLGIGPGGVWMDLVSGTMLWCLGADYAAERFTFELQNNFRVLGGATSLIEPVDWYRADQELRIVHGRYYTPRRPIVGDFTAGSTTVSNVRGGAGSDDVRPGDGLFLMTTSGLAHAGRIEAVRIDPAGAGEMVLSSPAVETSAARRLPLFVRSQAANGPA